MKNLLIVILIISFFSCANRFKDKLYNDFANLPGSVGMPWCYYYLINDDISKEGITKDMIAMKEAGIGTVLIGNINPAGVDGHVPLFSEEWWQAMVHAVNEGKRLGIDIGMFNCPGWSQSGGPWVTPDKAMQYVTYSEAEVTGKGKVQVRLPKPTGLFQDTYTLAFPTIDAEKRFIAALSPEVSSQPEIADLKNLFDGDLNTSAMLKPSKSEYKIDISVKREIAANSFLLYPAAPMICDCEFYASVHGKDSLISTFRFDRSNFSNKVGPIITGPLALSFSEVKSTRYCQTQNTNISVHSKVDACVTYHFSLPPAL